MAKLITLHKIGHSDFIVLWADDQTPGENIRDLGLLARYCLWGAWRFADVGGWGCVCGWRSPEVRRWPYWFWHRHYWRQHLRSCPVPRNEYGEMVD